MRIDEILASSRPVFSVEFFPPKTEEGREMLFETVDVLRKLGPSFFSVTYGAGRRDARGDPGDHPRDPGPARSRGDGPPELRGETSESLREIVDEIADAGIENILALRGDPPRGQTDFPSPTAGSPAPPTHGADQRAHPEIAIGGACFPEVHPEAASMDADIAYLKTKVENGASFLITQLFYDNRPYFDFVPAARAAGIEVPIIPGIMPMTRYEQIAADRRPLRGEDPGAPLGCHGGGRRQRAGGVRDRGRLRGPAVRGAARGRGAGNPLLRAQPLAGDAGDPRGAAGRQAVGDGPLRNRRPSGRPEAHLHSSSVPEFDHNGFRISYDEYGAGDRPLVLIHGLLMNRQMFDRLGPEMAERGNRVITIDLLGHGRSDRPADMSQYSMTFFARQVEAPARPPRSRATR